MKKMLRFISLALIISTGSAFIIQSVINWTIENEKAAVKFTLQAHGQELNGSFKGVKGEVKFDSTDLANSSFNCNIEVSTINTGVSTRDGHLQGASWFDAANYPTINFTSGSIVAVPNGYEARGKLSAKGISKDISIPFTFISDGKTGTFKGSFTMNRQDFKIGKPGDDPGNDILVNLEVPVSKSE